MTNRRAFSHADIIERAFNRPLLITPEKAQIILGVIGPRLNVGGLVVAGQDGGPVPIDQLTVAAHEAKMNIEVRHHDDGDEDDPALESRIFQMIDGVAVIKIRGTLVPENGLDPESGMTGYDGIRAKFVTALHDPAVKGILFDIASPGGEVTDLAELTRVIANARGTKPMRSVVRSMAASAAFDIAAATDEITMPDLGVVGSVGAVIMHADFSKNLEKEGITVTMIAAGAHKTDGNPFEPLRDETRAELQSAVDQARDGFASGVAARRGLSLEAVMNTEARVFRGTDARDAGFADQIMGWDESYIEFAGLVNGRIQRQVPELQPSAAAEGQTPAMESTMTKKTEDDRAAAAETEEVAATTAAPEPTQAAATDTEGKVVLGTVVELDDELSAEDGVLAERDRVTGIMAACKPGYEALAQKHIEDGSTLGEFALAILGEQDAKGGKKLGELKSNATAVAEALPADAGAGPSEEGGPNVAANFILDSMNLAGVNRFQKVSPA